MATQNGTTITGSQFGVNISEYARLTYTTSSTNTQVSVTFTLEVVTSLSNGQASPQTTDLSYSGSAEGQTGTGSKAKLVPSGTPSRPGTSSYTLALISNKTITYAKTKSAQTKTLSFSVRNTTLGKESLGSVSISVPAISSYSVTYNANTGSGTVSSQTKWYGENLTLQSSGFTKTNYTLIGWNTASDGSGQAYTLGSIYSANAALTLYAQWKYNYQKPTISNLSVFRVSSATATTEQDDGTYIKVSFDYLGGTFDNGLNRIAPSYEIYIDGGSAVASGTLSTAGTYSHNAFGTYSVNNAHTVLVRLYDSNDIDSPAGVTSTDYVSASTYPLDILADGSAMGIMIPAISGQKLTVPEEFYISSTKILDFIHPVGSYYETSKSQSEFDPNNVWGGTWSNESIKDVHIVDEGTTNDWTYRKWSDGKAECWKKMSLSSGSFTATGNVYYRSASGYSFPSGLFDAAPVVEVNADMGNVGAASALNITSSSFAIYTMSAVSTARAVSFSVYAVGTWKTYSAPTAIYRWHRTA